MNTLVNALHVVSAVLVTGPLVATPCAGRWLISRGNADGVKVISHLAALLGVGALLTAGFGVATVLTGDRWAPTTPWVVISATLFVVALGLVWGYAVPALRTAASLLAGRADTTPVPAATDSAATNAATDSAATGEGDPEATDADATAAPTSHDDIRRQHRLDTITARVTGAGWLLLVTFGVIAVLMTVRPFAS